MKAYLPHRLGGRGVAGVKGLLLVLAAAGGPLARGQAQPARRDAPTPFDRLSQAPGRVSAPPRPDAPAALLNGTPITWEDLRPSLTEAAGAQALQETVLDRLLGEQMKSRGLAISAADIGAERTLLTDSIVRDSKTTAADAERLLEQVRRTRGLGEERFNRLLERNAKMRKLVSGSVTVSDEEINQAFQISHGPTYRVRVILVSSEREAAEIRAQLVPATVPGVPPEPNPGGATPGSLALRFGELALKHSTDSSAPAGGLLDPISPADPAYPASIRQALQVLNVGEVSPVVAVDRGFALLFLDEPIPADGKTLAELTPQIRAELQKRHERLAMDDLARSLLRGAKLSIMDGDLDWSWKAAGPRLQP